MPPTAWSRRAFLTACTGIAATRATRGEEDPFATRRRALLRAIEGDVAATRRFIDRGALDARVMAAMGRVPRHLFVPHGLVDRAYENRPLPIGHGQTISQPYIVALMTDLLAPAPDDRVLEVGTGSGYQAAVLAELVAEVRTIEIIPALGEQAATRLAALGYANVETRTGDGYFGWPEAAPHDAIMVTAAARHVPPPLVEQLRPGGRMAIPVGKPFLVQQLLLVEKDEAGAVRSRQVLPVRFVPLTRGH